MQLHNNNRINAGKKRGVYLDDGQFRNNENILWLDELYMSII